MDGRQGDQGRALAVFVEPIFKVWGGGSGNYIILNEWEGNPWMYLLGVFALEVV